MLSASAGGGQALIKERIYNHLPFGSARSAISFIAISSSWLSRRTEGLIYHFLQGFWYRFLVAAKLSDCDRSVGKSKGSP